MFMKSIWIGFIGVMLFVASASAASSELQGIVRDAKQHPIKGADIQIAATKEWQIAHDRPRAIELISGDKDDADT